MYCRIPIFLHLYSVLTFYMPNQIVRTYEHHTYTKDQRASLVFST